MASQGYSLRHLGSDVSIGQCLAAITPMVSLNPAYHELPSRYCRPGH